MGWRTITTNGCQPYSPDYPWTRHGIINSCSYGTSPYRNPHWTLNAHLLHSSGDTCPRVRSSTYQENVMATHVSLKTTINTWIRGEIQAFDNERISNTWGEDKTTSNSSWVLLVLQGGGLVYLFPSLFAWAVNNDALVADICDSARGYPHFRRSYNDLEFEEVKRFLQALQLKKVTLWRKISLFERGPGWLFFVISQ